MRPVEPRSCFMRWTRVYLDLHLTDVPLVAPLAYGYMERYYMHVGESV